MNRRESPADQGWHNVQFVLIYDGQGRGYLYGQVPDVGDTPLCDPRIRIIITNGFKVTWEGESDDSADERSERGRWN